MKTVRVRCKYKPCGNWFDAREADVKRGWGKFCSKSCKAKEQEERTGRFRKLKRPIHIYPENDDIFDLGKREIP